MTVSAWPPTRGICDDICSPIIIAMRRSNWEKVADFIQVLRHDRHVLLPQLCYLNLARFESPRGVDDYSIRPHVCVCLHKLSAPCCGHPCKRRANPAVIWRWVDAHILWLVWQGLLRLARHSSTSLR